jgi:hypothetical protein
VNLQQRLARLQHQEAAVAAAEAQRRELELNL